MLVSENAKTKKLKNNVLTLAAEAKESKLKYPDTIDATIGMMFNEEGSMQESKLINKLLDEMTFTEKYSYSATSGGKKFKEGILRWALKDTYDYVTSKMEVEVIATPGGTGAIANTLANYVNRGNSVLFADMFWGPYTAMCKEREAKPVNYKLFDENMNFNISDLKEKIATIKKEDGRCLLIINDPCNNPTGYALEDNEWDEIVDYINYVTNDGTPFVLLYDMAYIDFSHKGVNGSREVLKKFTKFNDSVMVILAFSGSKTFSLYGMRIGAQVCLTKTKEAKEEFFYASEHSARGCWSNTSHAGITLVEKLMSDEKLIKDFEKEIQATSNLLLKRGALMVEEAKKVGLKTYPYKSGFFVTIPCNGQKTFEALKEKRIFVVPQNGSIRISLASISSKEIVGLGQKIKDSIIY